MIFHCGGIYAYPSSDLQGSISGKVVDAAGSYELAYVSVAVFRLGDNQLSGGVITNEDGVFVLKDIPIGEYYLQISCIGYQKKNIHDIKISSSQKNLDLGIIYLEQSSTQVAEVEVRVDKAPISYQLDKKVIEVSKHYTSISGSAVNILENVPSVTVDLEGNVALRGSNSFTVLINGVPSVLEPSEALQQIPSTTIESIEIITNPSVKYNPEGTSGIINVITKTKKGLGLNGLVNLKGGTNNAGGDVQLNLQSKKLSYLLAADYNYGDFEGEKYGERSVQNLPSIDHTGTIRYRFKRYNWRSGFEFRPDSVNQFGLELSYGSRSHKRNSDLIYREYRDEVYSYLSKEERNRDAYGFSGNASYSHVFGERGHKIISTLSYHNIHDDEENYNHLIDKEGLLINSNLQKEKEPAHKWQGKIDYTKPVGSDGNVQLGYELRLFKSKDESEYWEENEALGINWDDPLSENRIKYAYDVHAVYAIVGSYLGNLGYQVGLRSEYSKRELIDRSSTETKTLNVDLPRTDFFPSVHFSYELPNNQEVMTSYSRRVERGSSYYFEPFYTRIDAYNVRIGNQNLEPEFIDSYELNYHKKMEKTHLSLEAYYRHTHDKVEWVRRVYKEDEIQRSPENVGEDYALGLEASYSLGLINWWRIDLSGNIYHYKVVGNWDEIDYNQENFTWNYRLNQTLKIKKQTQLQANWRYYSKRITTQGYYKPVYTIDIALKKEFFRNKLTAYAELRDVFSTNNRENINEGLGFKDAYFQKFYTPILTFTLTYRFNQFQSKRNRSLDFGGEETMD